MKNTAYALVLVSSILAACGSDDGDTVTIGHNNASTGSDGGANDGAASTTTTPPSGPTIDPTSADAGGDACTPVAYYYDGDGDGVGGAQTEAACESPGAKWVTTGGDCDDGNADVFPGQTRWFGVSYKIAMPAQTSSFDYNCSTREEEKPDQAKASACTAALGANGCTGAGFLPNANSGAIAQSYCGSTRVRACRFTNGVCTAIDGASDLAFQCH